MNIYETILKTFLFEEDSSINTFFKNTPINDTILESFYDSILQSILNKSKNDNGNYDELDNIKKFKKDISKASKKQYKIIISYCKENEKEKIEDVLIKYNLLHFLKFAIRILDIDDEYNYKVNECKKYFSKKENLHLFDNLYHKSEIPYLEVKKLVNDNEIDFFEDLIIKKEIDNSLILSLSPKGKNLYAFFIMKNINIDNLATNYNEGKVNEVLEYLIKYITTQNSAEHKNIKKPRLNSGSANYNLDTVTYLIDRQDYINNRFISFFDEKDNWKEGRTWKINY